MMSSINIALIREEKVPHDTRTPITPKQARQMAINEKLSLRSDIQVSHEYNLTKS